MLHTINELVDKVSAMHTLSILLHREKYGKADGSYDRATVDHMVEQIQALAGDIYHDRTKHPKLVEKDLKKDVDNG